MWIPRREPRAVPTLPETMTLGRFLRIYISLFIGIVCTSSISLFLLAWIVNNQNISVNSLHHDFQTVYIVTTDQWLHNSQLRAAIELRWLWVSSSLALTIGLFPSEIANRLLRWLTSVKMYVSFSLITEYINGNDRVQNRSISNAICHGSLPVYISRSSSSSYSEAPVIPPLVRLSTLAPTFGSQATSVGHQQPDILPQTSDRDARSFLSQTCDGETIRPNVPSEPKEALQPCDSLQLSRSSQQTERVVNPTASVLTLADSTYPPSSFGRASSAFRTCEEGSIKR